MASENISAKAGELVNFARKDHPCVAYEAAFLGSVLTQSYRLEYDFGLLPENFFVPRHRSIWQGILELMRTGFNVDAGSLYTWATANDMTAAVGGYEYVHTHLRDASQLTLDADSTVGKILEASRVRRIRDELTELIRYIDSNPLIDGTEIASEVEKRMFEATQHLATVGVKALPKLMDTHKASFERRVDLGGRPIGIPIGIGPLDAILGGFKPGHLNGLMAAPGIGKSALMLSTMGYLASRKVETVLFSLEMNAESLINRAVASFGKLPLSDVQNGNPERAAEVRAVMNRLDNASTIHIGDAPSMTVEQIASELRRLKAERGRIDIVWIDHLDRKSVV
jgi:replicative DNA helicase